MADSPAPTAPNVAEITSTGRQSPGGPYEPSDPRWKEVRAKDLVDHAWEWRMPINFYGRVVDENEQPVSGASSSHNGAICRKRVQRTKPALLTAKAFSRSPEKLDAALQFAFPRMATTHLNDSRSASTTRHFGKRTTTYRTQTILYSSIFEKRTKERR